MFNKYNQKKTNQNINNGDLWLVELWNFFLI
jgi:hypothetical protein